MISPSAPPSSLSSLRCNETIPLSTITDPTTNITYDIITLLGENCSKGTYTYLVSHNNTKFVLKRNKNIDLAVIEASMLQTITIGVPEFISGFVENVGKAQIYYDIIEEYIEERKFHAGHPIDFYNTIIRDLLYIGSYLEDHYIIHGDIKLENIVFNADLVPYMIDFDLTIWSFYSHHTNAQYTPPYRPPEVETKKQISSKSDVWAMGVTFMVMTQWPKLRAYKFMNKYDPLEARDAILKVLGGVNDPKFRTLISNMLKVDPIERWSFQECYRYYLGKAPDIEPSLNLPYPYPLENNKSIDLKERFYSLQKLWIYIKNNIFFLYMADKVYHQRFVTFFANFVMLFDRINIHLSTPGLENDLISVCCYIMRDIIYPDNILPENLKVKMSLLKKALAIAKFQVFGDIFALLNIPHRETLIAFLVTGHVLFTTREEVTSMNIPAPNEEIRLFYKSLNVEPPRKWTPGGGKESVDKEVLMEV